MFLPGYDAWKTRLPDDDAEECPCCGGAMYRHNRDWYCETCEHNTAPDPDYEYDRMRDDAMEPSRWEAEDDVF